MHGRRKAREVALQVLYSLNYVNLDVEKAFDLFWDNFVAPKEAKDFAAILVEGTWSHKDELDQMIAGCSDNWSLGRMPKVDISILRLAVFEFLYCPDIPPKVTLNEAIDLKQLSETVKIITDNSRVDPKRLTAAGRSEYQPIDNSNTATGRAKNRRTEIILTPKLDELFKILEIQ